MLWWAGKKRDRPQWLRFLLITLTTYRGSQRNIFHNYSCKYQSKEMLLFLLCLWRRPVGLIPICSLSTQMNAEMEEIQFPGIQRTRQTPQSERERKAAELVWEALVQHPSLVRGVDRGGPQLFVRIERWTMPLLCAESRSRATAGSPRLQKLVTIMPFFCYSHSVSTIFSCFLPLTRPPYSLFALSKSHLWGSCFFLAPLLITNWTHQQTIQSSHNNRLKNDGLCFESWCELKCKPIVIPQIIEDQIWGMDSL